MTVLAVDCPRSFSGGEIRRLPVEAAANPYAGSALSYASTGYVHELVAGERFAGFARARTSTPTASGDVAIEVQAGRFQAIMPISGVALSDVDRRVYATDDNTFTFTQSSAATLIGRVIGYESSGYAIVQCDTVDVNPVIRHSLLDAGTVVTNTTTRTASASHTIKAGTLKPGSQIKVRGIAVVAGSHSDATLNVDIGGAVGGTPASIIAAGAEDAVDNEVLAIDLELTIRTVGATGTAAGTAWITDLAASDTAAPKGQVVASFTIDTTADIVLGLYLTWSYANAGNQARADVFNVEIIP